jgi:hypothetical protein
MPAFMDPEAFDEDVGVFPTLTIADSGEIGSI